MARFVMVTGAAIGHVVPSMSIARELIEHGHEVVWITGSYYKEKVEKTGARFHPIPQEIDLGNMEVYDFWPELKELKGIAQAKWYIKHVFLDTCLPLIKSIDEVLKYFPADVLVGDSIAFGLYFKSEMEALPSASISLLPLALPSRDTAPFGLGLLPGNSLITKARNRLLNFLTNHVLLRDVTTYANDVRRQLGLKPLKSPFFSAMFEIPLLIMHISTPTFEYPRSDQPAHLHFIGPVLSEPDHAFQPPNWWADLNSSKTVVLVNQGTIARNLDDLIVPTIKGLKDQQMLVVAVPVKEGGLGELPDYVRTEPFIPFWHLLPHVNVMVTNGGYGGTQMALAHGIPLVVAGETDDKMEVAARVEWAGAGINLKKQRPSPDEVRDAVRKVLVNPVYRENARRIQSDFAKYDAPTRAVELLEALANGE